MPEFEALCVAGEAEAQARLAGAEGPEDGDLDPAFESIRRGADGRLKVQARGKRRWSLKAEDRFFAVLRECGNVAASARAAGVSREAVWKRRREWPAFARRLEETLDEAEVVLEFRVACLGTNWTEEAEERDLEVEEDSPSQEAPPPRFTRFPSPAKAGEDSSDFDREFALRFLKWREDKRRGKRSAVPSLPSVEEVRERIVRKALAIRRHREREERRRSEGEEE